MKKIVLCFTVMGTLLISNSYADLDDGLVAHYEFEGNANDSSGNDNNGTEHGGVTYVDGVIGKAAKFDGVDDYIEIKDSNLLDLSSTFTISVWIKQYGIQSQGYRMIDKTTAGVNDGYDFDTYCGGNGHAMRLAGGTNNSCANSEYSLNEWHHLLVTFKDEISKFYLDGAYDGSGYHNSDIKTNNLTLRIGYAHGELANNEYFYGAMDEIRIYNRALSESEIKELYDLGIESMCTQQIIYAKSPITNTWYSFNTPCDVPANWETNTTKPIDFNTTITSTITKTKIDNLNTGWHLLGTSTPINNLDIFDNAKTIWKYDNNNWKAYSPDSTLQSLINSNPGIDTLQNIKADEGFWINK